MFCSTIKLEEKKQKAFFSFFHSLCFCNVSIIDITETHFKKTNSKREFLCRCQHFQMITYFSVIDKEIKYDVKKK